MSNIAFCSKAFRRKTWVIIGYENQVIQNKNRFRFTPICPTRVLTIDNIILYNFSELTILTILYKFYAGTRVRFADRVWQLFLCRLILMKYYIHFVIFTKNSKLHFSTQFSIFFSIKIYLYTLSLKIYKNGHCNLELKIGTTNVCKYPILI